MRAKPAVGAGILIERAMQERGLNRKEVAHAVGVSVATLSRWAHRVGMPAALTIALEGPDVEPLRVSSPMSLAITLEAAEPLQRRLAQACA